MNQEQLWHAIRASCAILATDDIDHVVIIGSQSLLGTYSESDLPDTATLSQEVDILPPGPTRADTERMADILTGVAGELSVFDETHGFHLDGVDETTAVLPQGWQDRLVRVSNASTVDPITGRVYTGWCLDPYDLCASKACAMRDKDRNFIRALVDAGIVDPLILIERLTHISDATRAEPAIAWVSSLVRRTPTHPSPG